MKKIILFCLFIVACGSLAWGQLKVEDNNVAIGYSSYTYTPLSSLTVGTQAGSTDTRAFISGGQIPKALTISNSGLLSTMYGIYSSVAAVTGKGISVQGESGISGYGGGGSAIGVRGMAGGSAFVNLAWGVSGLVGAANGTGIYGGVSVTDPEATIVGQYAGYFNGTLVATNGTLNADVLVLPGDARAKTAVQSLDATATLAGIAQLQPVEYRLQQVAIATDSTNADGVKVAYTIPRYDETTDVFQRKRYGLVAQDVQKVYPELVHENGDGLLAIDYVGLVPLLLQAVQAQQQQIEGLQNEIEKLKNK